MFDNIFKKKVKKPAPSGNGAGNGDDGLEKPDVDETLAKLDKALREAEDVKLREREEESRKNGFSNSRCGCGGSSW